MKNDAGAENEINTFGEGIDDTQKINDQEITDLSEDNNDTDAIDKKQKRLLK